MNTEAYEAYLLSRNVPEQDIAGKLQAAGAFEQWLAETAVLPESAGKREVEQYAARLIQTGGNTAARYEMLCEYAAFSKLRTLYVALVEVTDCYEAMAVLRDTILKQHGAAMRDRIFAEPLPPLGADEKARLKHTKQISERMNQLLTPQQIHAAWFQVQHGIPREFWDQYDDTQRKKYADCDSLDDFLNRMGEDRSAMLKRLHDERRLWFTQEVTDAALDYLIQSKHMQLGEHNGRKGILITKVPYMADRMLHAEDEKMKRYFTCHCPLVREAILRDEMLADDVCYCSLGHASHFLSGMGLEGLEGEVIESAVKGDARCRFIFYLPEEE